MGRQRGLCGGVGLFRHTVRPRSAVLCLALALSAPLGRKGESVLAGLHGDLAIVNNFGCGGEYFGVLARESFSFFGIRRIGAIRAPGDRPG